MNAPALLAPPRAADRQVSPALWVAGLLGPLLLFWLDALNWRYGIVSGGSFWGRDFVNLWTGGQLVRVGDWRLLYDVEAYQAFQRGLIGPLGPHNYSYPPVSFPLAALFSLLPYAVALAAWMLGTAALFAYACRPYWPRSAGPAWLVLLTPAALLNVWAGHYGFLVGALFLLGWRKLDRGQPVRAGLLFGCMLIKPHLAILIPMVLLVRREWTALASGGATVAALIAATGALFGFELWLRFIMDVGGTQSAMINAGGAFYGLMSTSAATAVLRVTGAGWLAATLQLALALSAIAALLSAARRNPPVLELGLFAGTLTFLVLPYAFNYDMTVVMVAAVATLARAERQRHRLLAAGGFLAPIAGMLGAALLLPLTPLLVGGFAWAQWQALRDPVRPLSRPFKMETAPAR